MPEAHARRYGASSSPVWLNCPGAGALAEKLKVKRSSSKFSRAGTAEHTVVSECLEQHKSAASYIGKRIPVEHETVEVTDDSAKHMQVYLDHITGLVTALDGELLVEQRLDYGPAIGVDDPDCAWGTGDAVILAAQHEEIISADYKGGAGEAVDAEGNTQTQLYALGALLKVEQYMDVKTVRSIIIQPRNGGVSEWVQTVDELYAFAEVAKEAVRMNERAYATADNMDDMWNSAYLNPGEKQCRWCPAKATCPELRNEVTKTVFMHTVATPEDFADEVVPDKKHIEPADSGWLAATMAKTDLIEGWLKAIRAEVEKRLLAGDEVPGYKLVRGKQGNRAWADETAAEDLLRKQFRLKIEDAYEMKLISPTAAEKLLAKESPKRWAKCTPLISRSEGKIHVAPQDDKREAISVAAVADEFEAILASDNPADSNEFA